MLGIGTSLGDVGSWASLARVVVQLADRVRHLGALGLVGLVLLPGAWLVHVEHVFPPLGVLGMLSLGVGSAARTAVPRRRGVIAHTSDR